MCGLVDVGVLSFNVPRIVEGKFSKHKIDEDCQCCEKKEEDSEVVSVLYSFQNRLC